jgi:hypothetical protein
MEVDRRSDDAELLRDLEGEFTVARRKVSKVGARRGEEKRERTEWG